MDRHAKGLATIERPVEIPSTDADELLEVSSPASSLNTVLLLWNSRQLLFRVAVWGALASTLIAFAIPKHYTSTMALMPPDQQSGMGTAMLAALAGKAGGSSASVGGGGLATLAGDVLGIKTSGDLFMGVLRSRTVEENLVRKFDLRKVYGDRFW